MAPPWIDKGAAGGPTRWVVREGSERGKGRYLSCSQWEGVGWLWDGCGARHRFQSREGAALRALAAGRVVAILTHEQAKAKAAAEALREMADDMANDMGQLAQGGAAKKWIALWVDEARARADALWPARGRGRGR